MMDDEVLGNIFEDLWKKMLDALRKSGKFGEMVAKLMESYRKRIGEMIVKIIKKEGEAFIKIINDIKEAIIKIITGNDVDMVNDKVLGNIFEDLWKKMLDALRKSGKFGEMVAKLMESYRKRIGEMIVKTASLKTANYAEKVQKHELGI